MRDLCIIERENLGRGEWTVKCTVCAYLLLGREEENLELHFYSALDRAISWHGERQVFDPIWERMIELFAEQGLERFQKIPCIVEYITGFEDGKETIIPTKITVVKKKVLDGYLYP